MVNILQFHCPICQRVLTEEHKISYIDYYCSPSREDHHYAVRFKGDEVIKMKVRLTDSQSTLYVKMNFDEGYLEVWTKENQNRIKINQTFTPDFTEIDKLKTKIRTYLTFS